MDKVLQHLKLRTDPKTAGLTFQKKWLSLREPQEWTESASYPPLTYRSHLHGYLERSLLH